MGRKLVELRESVQKTVHVNGTNGGLALDRIDAGPIASGGGPGLPYSPVADSAKFAYKASV